MKICLKEEDQMESVRVKKTAPYTLTNSERKSENNVNYTAYGISYIGPYGRVAYIDDISCEKAIVAKMVEMFNACELPPSRIKAAIVALLP